MVSWSLVWWCPVVPWVRASSGITRCWYKVLRTINYPSIPQSVEAQASYRNYRLRSRERLWSDACQHLPSDTRWYLLDIYLLTDRLSQRRTENWNMRSVFTQLCKTNYLDKKILIMLMRNIHIYFWADLFFWMTFILFAVKTRNIS